MQSKITLKLRQALRLVCLFSLVLFSYGKTTAQGTLTTSYTPLSGLAGSDCGISFVIQNTNATDRVLTTVNSYWNPATTAGPTTAKLWYTTTNLSGGGSVATPTWTALTGFIPITVSAAGIIPTFTGLNVVLTAGTQYRFAVESTNGIAYGAAGTTPNNITADGIVLKTGDAQIAAQNVGYAMNPMPTFANNPRFFAGTIVWTAATACAGTPTPGNTLSSAANSCTGVGFVLSTSNTPAPGTTGLSYQWQSSPTIGGTYNDILGANQPTYTTTQTVATAYRVKVTCANGGANATSTPILVGISATCYCTASSTDVDPTFEKIANVTFGGINQNSAVVTGYLNYLTDTAKVIAGGTYPLSITGNANTYGGDVVAVWIDWNQDGDFNDAGEAVYNSGESAGPYNGTVLVPASALLGTTRMRVRLYDDIFGTGNNTPCGTNTYGQVQDFSVQVSPCVAATVTLQPVDASTSCGNAASFVAKGSGSFPSFQWQYRTPTTPAGIWLNVPVGSPYSVVAADSTSTLTISPTDPSMSGYLYRALLSGACIGSTPTSSASLTITTLVTAVSPSSAAICTGGIQQLSITTIPAPIVAEFSSGTLNTTIPDGVVTGINNTIAVSGIPAGAVVSDVSIKLNVAHTYVSDLEVVIKGPNGQILNLSNLIGGGNNPAQDFTNTIFSSNGTAALNTGVSPGFTGIFKPDAAGAVAAFGIPGGPTGFLPTLPGGNVNGVSTILNGNWTIAMYDAGPPDEGTLLNWSVIITYGAPGSGTWTGPAGTIFTNAAATIPYTGTNVNTVYVKPTANGVNNYTATIITPTCTGTTVTVPVTVNSSVTGTPAVANVAACAGTNAVFSITGITGGTGLTYQWQVSTLAVPAFTNIAGANSATYTVTGATAASNGNQYRVMVSSAGCSATLTSTAGTLTVNPVPVVTISAAPVVNIYPGLTSTLTAAVSSATSPLSYQWYLNGSPVAGATANTYVVSVDGEGKYTVQVTDANGCVSAAGTSTPSFIKIGDSSGVTILFIYPSPNSGRFQVRYFNDINNGGTAPAIVNVYDEKGARVYTQRYSLGAGYNAMNVDLGTHGKGLYRVELLDLNGNRIKTGSVMVF